MLKEVQQWLQAYMDMATDGHVNLHICDGKPGNCTLYPMDTKQIARNQSLQGNLWIKYRSRFRLMYLDRRLDSDWLENLSDYIIRIESPMTLEITGCKLRPEGTAEYTGILTLEYEYYYGMEDT